MEEKKLTDKEIIQSLECCSKGCRDKSCFGSEMDGIATCTNLLTQNALSLINRQKAEIERLTERAERVAICEKDYLEWATGFLKTRFDIKDWFTNPEHQRTPCTYEFFASTLWAKIESAMKCLFDLDEQNKKIRRENAELQKQVDELREQVLMAKLQGLNEGYNNGVQAERNAQIFKPMITKLPKEIAEPINQQAEKATAKEIYSLLDTMKVPEDGRHQWRDTHNDCIDRCKSKIKERYGVEVE